MRRQNSIALVTPMCCTISLWPPSSGRRPKRSVPLVRRALSAAMRKSQARASERPVCTATPLIAAMVILSSSRTALLSGCEIMRRP